MRCVFSSLELLENYSLALKRHTGQTALLQALTLDHMDQTPTRFLIVNVVDNVD